MFKRFVPRAVLVAVAVASLSLAAVSPVLGSGSANWQITFAATEPGFGFWGWCDLSGGTPNPAGGPAISGTSGDCEFSEYQHQPGGPSATSGTCHQSVNLMPEDGQPAWQQEKSSLLGMTDWFFSGTAVTNPPNEIAFCQGVPEMSQGLLGIFPPTFSNTDSLLPAIPGHSNLAATIGFTEYQLNEQPHP